MKNVEAYLVRSGLYICNPTYDGRCTMAFYSTCSQPKKQDLWETPDKSIDMILDRLDPSVHFIWEPFVGTGRSTRYMISRGFQVTNGDDDPDFFRQSVPGAPTGMKTVLVSNPPFSAKREILRHLDAIGMHDVALLLPAPVLFTKYFRAFCDNHPVQIVVHNGRCSFIDPAKVGKGCGARASCWSSTFPG